MMTSQALQDHVDALRQSVERASCRTWFDDGRDMVGHLWGIATTTPSDGGALEHLYDTRRRCLSYVNDLERGKRVGPSRTAALVSIDLLEAALSPKVSQAVPLEAASFERQRPALLVF